jgi:protease-4
VANQNNPNKYWEQETIEKLLFATIKEQRRRRKWGIAFKIIGFGYLIAMTIIIMAGDQNMQADSRHEHTAVVDVYGPIAQDQHANAMDINKSIQNAFKHKQTKGVILKVNSPGGSPVQARQIYNNIIRLRSEYPEIKVYAAIEDLGTSAAYLISSAADYIYADETSIVGSIGVIMNGFGFVGTLDKIGAERRVYTAGKNKAMLDPFSPTRKEDLEFIQQQLDLTHQVFINDVVSKRPQLANHKDKDDIFSGKFWMGSAALDLGLIDGFGDPQYIASEVIKVAEMRDFTVQPSFMERLSSRFKLMFASSIKSLWYYLAI